MDLEIGFKTLIKIHTDHIIVKMCSMFQVNWTSTSSKTTLTKILNLKQDRQTDNEDTDLKNILISNFFVLLLLQKIDKRALTNYVLIKGLILGILSVY